MRQAIIWSNYVLVYWRIYVSLELKFKNATDICNRIITDMKDFVIGIIIEHISSS